MDILIIANFCMDFQKNDNGRFSYLAKLLSKNHDVEIVTSSFYHVTKSQRNNVNEHNYKVTLLYEPGYKKNISIKRFYSHFKWGMEVQKYLKERKRPDVIYCAIPSLTAPYVAATYCEKNKIKFILDIQDLWPEAFQMAFNIPVFSKVCFYPFKVIADQIYRKADKICAVSESYVNRGLSVNNKISAGSSVYLGTDLTIFDSNARKETDFKIDKSYINIAYCGTLGKSYDIKCVINAMKLVDNERLKLIVMGDGPKRAEFEEYALKQKVRADFLGRVSYDKMCSILSRCDITVNPIIGLSVASIINKHADYAACGLPVLNTQNSKEYIGLVNDYNMGLNSSPGDSNGLANNIQKLIKDPDKRELMGNNSRLCAEEKFNREYTYQNLIKVIEGDKDARNSN